MDKRVVVTKEDLTKAITVWLRVMPKRLWRELEAYHIAAQERRQGSRPNIEQSVAEHLASHFERANWETTYPKPLPPSSPPPYRGPPHDAVDGK